MSKPVYDLTYEEYDGTLRNIQVINLTILNRTLERLQQEGAYGFIILNNKTGAIYSEGVGT